MDVSVDWMTKDWETREDDIDVGREKHASVGSRMRLRDPDSSSEPLIRLIQAQFAQCGGSAGTPLRAENISRYWGNMAEEDLRRRSGASLSAQDKQAIALRVAQSMNDMDIRGTGEIGLDEWTHYLLLTNSASGYALQQVNSVLKQALEANKNALRDLLRAFQGADKSKRGILCFDDVVDAYKKRIWHTRPGERGAIKPYTDAEIAASDLKQLAVDIIEAMDTTGDEHITYHEFMAYRLGRSKEEVLIHLYDISKGAAENISPWLIGERVEAVWHTGVVLYGKEYYFTKDLVCADAGQTGFKEPKHIRHLGFTLWRRDELHEFIVSELRPVFQRDTYDVVCNNCNHFSDRLCMYLVGKHCPQEVLAQPDLLLRSRSVRLVRPLLNYWLRDWVVQRPPGTAPPQGERLKPGQVPPLGSVLYVHTAPETTDRPPVVAQVCSAESASVATVATLGMPGRASMGLDLGVCGCTGFWCGPPCAAKNAVGSITGLSVDGVWVQYFDISPENPHGRLRTEMVPHSRLSPGNISGIDGESVYRIALSALGESFHHL